MQVGGIAQPTALHDVVSDGTGDEVVTVGIAAVDEEFRHAVTNGGAFDMFAECPPTVIIHLTEVLLRTVEERDVLKHPLRRGYVGNGGDDVLILHCVEIRCVVGEIIVFEYGSSTVGIERT